MRLQACLNGARPPATPGLPLTPAAMAADAAAARAAGAFCLHVHPRDAAGAESLRGGDVAAVLRAIRAAVPGMAVGISTGDWIAPRTGRLAVMADWSERPDYVSVNLSEPDAPQVLDLMRRLGVGIELGLASVADLDRYLALPGDPAAGVVRAMIEMEAAWPEARAEAGRMRATLAGALPAVPVLLHGFDATAWDFIALARGWGCQTRIGLEDVLRLPDGAPAGNAALVAAAAEMLRG